MAVRAVAFVGRSRWGGRPHRRVSYDAWWADGRVDTDVSLSSVMPKRLPADAADFEAVVNGLCPEVGPGRWCDEHHRVVDGPAAGPSDLDPTLRPRGRRRDVDVPRRDPTTRPTRVARLVTGLVALILGVVLLVATSGAGTVAFVGAVCLCLAVGLLADFVPRTGRWW